MKRKLKLLTVLQINHASTMIDSFIDNLSYRDTIIICKHLIKIETRIRNA